MLRCVAIDDDEGPGEGKMAAMDADDMVFVLMYAFRRLPVSKGHQRS